MKRILPIIAAIALILTGCSKNDTPDPDKQIQEVKTGMNIRDKYVSTIPELKGYQHFIEGTTKDKKYKVVVANRDVELLVAFIDDKGNSKSKLTTSITTDLKGRVGSIKFIDNNTFQEGNAAVLAIHEKDFGQAKDKNGNTPVLAFEVVYGFNNSINILESNVSNDLNKYLSSLTFTNKTVWFLSNGKVYMFNRVTGQKTLESKDTSILIERNALALFYFEDNRMIAITPSFGDLKVSCHPLTNASGNFLPIWESSIKGKSNVNKEDIIITDESDNIIVTLKNDNSVYKFKKSDGEPIK